MKYNKNVAKGYMWQNYEDHIDYSCNVLNATGLAEDACDHFNAYLDDDFTVPDDFYDWAHEISSELIKRGICQL